MRECREPLISARCQNRASVYYSWRCTTDSRAANLSYCSSLIFLYMTYLYTTHPPPLFLSSFTSVLTKFPLSTLSHKGKCSVNLSNFSFIFLYMTYLSTTHPPPLFLFSSTSVLTMIFPSIPYPKANGRYIAFICHFRSSWSHYLHIQLLYQFVISFNYPRHHESLKVYLHYVLFKCYVSFCVPNLTHSDLGAHVLCNL